MATTGGFALTTTMGVINRVHRDAAHRRTATAPARSARFAQRTQVVLAVAHLTEGGATLCEDTAHLTRTHTQSRITALARNQLT